MNWRSFPAVISTRSASPWKEGFVSVARRGSSIDFPATFQLLAATNPCPCGFYGDSRRPCECRPDSRAVSVPYLRPTARPLRPDSPGRPGRGDGVLGAGRRNECICRRSSNGREPLSRSVARSTAIWG